MLSIKTLEDIYVTEELREKLFTKTVPIDLWRFVHFGDKNAKEKSINRESSKKRKGGILCIEVVSKYVSCFRISALP